MSFLRPNIDSKGRVIRGAGALALAVGAALAWPHSPAAGIALAVSLRVRRLRGRARLVRRPRLRREDEILNRI